jgi:hypothetical protein
MAWLVGLQVWVCWMALGGHAVSVPGGGDAGQQLRTPRGTAASPASVPFASAPAPAPAAEACAGPACGAARPLLAEADERLKLRAGALGVQAEAAPICRHVALVPGSSVAWEAWLLLGLQSAAKRVGLGNGSMSGAVVYRMSERQGSHTGASMQPEVSRGRRANCKFMH